MDSGEVMVGKRNLGKGSVSWGSGERRKLRCKKFWKGGKRSKV